MLLKKLALALTERKDELYAVSARTGATKADSLGRHRRRHRRAVLVLGQGPPRDAERPRVVDGPVERLSKDGSFLGRHIYTRLPGVAVQINAFNFPVWGSLEKFAPAFLAGMPSSSSRRRRRLPRRGVRADPRRVGPAPRRLASARQRRVPTLFDHLRLGDIVGFTGSASTAERLRAHDSVQTGGVRFTSETDSINASILGPDAVPGRPSSTPRRQLVTR